MCPKVSGSFNFGILNKDIKRKEIFAEFELLYAQLAQHVPVCNEAGEALKARLSDLTHSHCGLQNELSDFHIQHECLSAVHGLWSNPDVQICRPDRGTDIVILNMNDSV